MDDKEEKIKKSLKYSIFDGAFYSMMIGFGESFFSVFAVFLKATNLQLGLLGSLPQTLGSLFQLFTNRLIKLFKSRKKLVYISVLLQALMYIPVALVFFFGTFRVIHLIIFLCIYWIFGTIANPAWNSWIGDLVNEKERGSYFGRRNRVTGFLSFASLLAAGYILQRFSSSVSMEYLGFVIIFSLAMFSRILSFIYLMKAYEPEYTIDPESHFSFIDFIKQARFRNYGLFVIYLCFINFGVYVSAVFFTPYMLYDLKLSYGIFTIITAAAMIMKFVMMPVWGNLSDKYGTKKVLTLAGFLMPVVPVLWIFSANIWYLILIQLYSGFIWAGFDMASFNFIFDSTSPKKRTTCVAYYNVLNGIAILLGAIIGGFIVRYNNLFWSKYFLVFIISFMLRYIASLIFIPKIREVRVVEEISHRKLLLKAFTAMPTRGLIYNIVTLRKKKQGTGIKRSPFRFRFKIKKD